jgi:L-fucose mutarotase
VGAEITDPGSSTHVLPASPPPRRPDQDRPDQEDRVLRYGLTHPDILRALGAAGHGATVLIADGHYPVSTAAGPAAERVWLNLAPGTVTATQVLQVLVDVLAVEDATVMQPPAGEPEPAAHADFRGLLGPTALRGVDRFAFYAAARGPDLALVIATGDVRTYANLMLTIGVADPQAPHPGR